MTTEIILKGKDNSGSREPSVGDILSSIPNIEGISMNNGKLLAARLRGALINQSSLTLFVPWNLQGRDVWDENDAQKLDIISMIQNSLDETGILSTLKILGEDMEGYNRYYLADLSKNSGVEVDRWSELKSKNISMYDGFSEIATPGIIADSRRLPRYGSFQDFAMRLQHDTRLLKFSSEQFVRSIMVDRLFNNPMQVYFAGGGNIPYYAGVPGVNIQERSTQQ